MDGRGIRIVALALGLAVLVGALVGGMSQMTAVSVKDPRPSVPPSLVVTTSIVPTPTIEPSPSSTPTPSPTATPFAGGEVWLYTVAVGDSLSGLAIRYGTTTDELLELNPAFAENQDLVEVGAPMTMPCTPIAAAEDRC